MRLTERDIDILDCLTLRVRLLSLSQLADGWHGHTATPRKNAAAQMSRLERAGFATRKRVSVTSLPPLEQPVIQWRVGDATPDCEAAAHVLQTRWQGAPRMTRVYVATTATANAFGRDKRPFAATQATHDLGLAALYLKLRAAGFETGLRFIGEDVIGKAGDGMKDPDAFIVDRHGVRVAAIEYGGRYPAKRCLEFHEHCRQGGLPYSIW